MTWAGRSRSRSLARPVSARTRRTSPGGNALAITPRLMWSLTRMPAGRPAGMRAIIAARPRASASMAQLSPYVNRIALREVIPEARVMTTSRVDRRLAAILAADVVGYSRLVERDEQDTLTRLKAHRKELVKPLVAEHAGRIV